MKKFNKLTSAKLMIFFAIVMLLTSLVLSLETSYGSEIKRDNYQISRSKVDRTVTYGSVFRDYVEISNLENRDLVVEFLIEEEISKVIESEVSEVIVEPKNKSQVALIVVGKEIGNFSGNVVLGGDIQEVISVNLTIVEEDLRVPFLVEVEFANEKFIVKRHIDFKLNVNKVRTGFVKNTSVSYNILDKNNNSYFLSTDYMDINNSFQILKRFNLPEELEKGSYTLETIFEYDNRIITHRAPFGLRRSFFTIMVLGFIPMWLILLVIGLGALGFIIYYITRIIIQRKQKYKMKLDLKKLPQKNPDFFFLGSIAEKKNLSYFDPARLTTHTIVAGATGGGKSISAQVIIEEALLHDVAVIVFDPTAQWSGMLRKCDDKKMLSYYPKFGLKETDAKAFKGNIREVKNARELINIKKYMNPGQIQIFTLNKLDPKDIDMFVANVIRQVFKSDPKEAPNLKLILVFDEVHRLLSKFGGSGEGFLQVERACREFRKWGIGVMLISQVLSDFVGEIKANISTEVQMRTRDEGDLNRIKIKYGEDFLQSLVKASVGVGMVVNPAYNHARPYFVNFRPILHNTRRLPDEELEKYNKYNDIADDLEYQIEQLEKEKVDTFDLKMELKLVKDKIMTGNFSVVEIYLEGLKPRLEKEWEKLGKKPKKREIQLIAKEEIQKSIEEAKKSRAKFEKEEAKKKKVEKPVKESVESKEIKPLTFDNGLMVSSARELKSVLPALDDEIFKTHVNKNKNDIATWISENLSKEFGEKLKLVTDKATMIKELENLGKPIKKKIIKKDKKIPVKTKQPVNKKTIPQEKSKSKVASLETNKQLKNDKRSN